jgi:hypothetical protein
VRCDGIEKTGYKDCCDNVAGETKPLRDRAGHDRSGGTAEGELKNEERGRPDVVGTESRHEEGTTDQTATCHTKRKSKSEQPEENRCNAEVRDVLDRNIYRVLASRESRFDPEKSRLHKEHQAGTDDHPQRIKERSIQLILHLHEVNTSISVYYVRKSWSSRFDSCDLRGEHAGDARRSEFLTQIAKILMELRGQAERHSTPPDTRRTSGAMYGEQDRARKVRELAYKDPDKPPAVWRPTRRRRLRRSGSRDPICRYRRPCGPVPPLRHSVFHSCCESRR